MKLHNQNIIKYLLVLLFTSLFFQNFIFPTKPETSVKLNAADPSLNLALKRIDDAYLDYTRRLNLSKARGRIAQLDFEHKKMKSDLIRAAAVLNPDLLNISAEAGNYAADSSTLNAMMQLPSRRGLYVVSVQDATATSAPTNVRVIWNGTKIQKKPLFDVVLISNVKHDWNFIDQGVNGNLPKSFVASPTLVPINSTISHNMLPGSPILSSQVFPIQPNTTTKALFMMDELIKQAAPTNVILDYELRGNYAVNAGGSLTITINEIPTPVTVLRGPLTASIRGTKYTLPNIPAGAAEAIGAPSVFPGLVSAEEAFRYADYFEKNFLPYPPEVEIFWRGLLIKPAVYSLPLPITTMAPFEIYGDQSLKVRSPILLSEVYAKSVCDKYLDSDKISVHVSCQWNGKIIKQRILPVQPPSEFQKISQAVFAPKCMQCHNSVSRMGGLDISSYSSLMNPAGRYVIPGAPEQSRLFLRLVNASPHPPTVPLTNTEISMIREWISAGAKN